MLKDEMTDPFSRADFREVIRILDEHFGDSTYSLRSIFHDDQRKILDIILKSTLDEAEAVYRQVYDTHAPMMRFVTDLHIPLPRAFSIAAQFALNSNLRRAIEDPGDLDFTRIQALIEEARAQNVSLDGATLGFALRSTIVRLSRQFRDSPDDMALMKKLEAAAGLARSMPFEVNVWRAQNKYYDMLQNIYPGRLEQAMRGEGTAREWVEHFVEMGKNLAVKVETPAIPELEMAS
jgi:hypothetical protein